MQDWRAFFGDSAKALLHVLGDVLVDVVDRQLTMSSGVHRPTGNVEERFDVAESYLGRAKALHWVLNELASKVFAPNLGDPFALGILGAHVARMG